MAMPAVDVGLPLSNIGFGSGTGRRDTLTEKSSVAAGCRGYRPYEDYNCPGGPSHVGPSNLYLHPFNLYYSVSYNGDGWDAVLWVHLGGFPSSVRCIFPHTRCEPLGSAIPDRQ